MFHSYIVTVSGDNLALERITHERGCVTGDECASVAKSGVKCDWTSSGGVLGEEGVRYGSTVLDPGGDTLEVYV